MISRQSFFKRLAAVIVAVALAPEIVFGARIAPSIPPPELDLMELFDAAYDMMHSSRYQENEIIYTDSKGVEACERWLAQCQPPNLA